MADEHLLQARMLLPMGENIMKFRREGRYWIDEESGARVPVIAGGEPLTTAALIAGGGAIAGGLLSKSKASRKLERLSSAAFDTNTIQRLLPPELRANRTGAIIDTGIQGIGDLIRNPGGLSPTVSDAIRPRLAAESESIAGNFRGIQAQATGAAARSNTPVSLKDAVARAINVAQERAQRGARREALSDSDKLRRQDLNQTFSLLDSILQFISSARGQGIQGLAAATGFDQREQASNLAGIGNLVSNLAQPGTTQPATLFPGQGPLLGTADTLTA